MNIDDFEIKNGVLLRYFGDEERVVIPKTVRKIESAAFDDEIKEIVISANVEEIESESDVFNIPELTKIKVDKNNKRYKSIDGVLFSKDGKTLICYPQNKMGSLYVIPDGVEKIDWCAFEGAKELMNVVIPESVSEIMPLALHCGEKLCNIDVHENNQHYKSVDGVLFSKDGKTLVCYPIKKKRRNKKYVIPDGVETISDHAFDGCLCLQEVIIPDSVKTISDYAFCDCALKKVSLPENIIEIGDGVFDWCDDIEHIELFEKMLKDEERTLDLEYAFNEDVWSDPAIMVSVKSDESITVCSAPEFVDAYFKYKLVNGVLFDKSGTSLIQYPSMGFESTYRIPEGVKYIKDSAFEDCTNLSRVIIPDGVIGIEDYAFVGSGLTSLAIGKGLQYIKRCAFKDCKNLRYVELMEISIKDKCLMEELREALGLACDENFWKNPSVTISVKLKYGAVIKYNAPGFADKYF